MSDMDRQLEDVKKQLENIKISSETINLKTREEYKKTVDELLKQTRVEMSNERERMKQQYINAYDRLQSELISKMNAEHENIYRAFEELKAQMEYQIKREKYKVSQNTERIQKFEKGQAEKNEKEEAAALEELEKAKEILNDIKYEALIGLLEPSIMDIFEQNINIIKSEFAKEFYQSVIASSISFTMACREKKDEMNGRIMTYAKYVKRLLDTIEEANAFIFGKDGFLNKQDYLKEFCRNEKFSVDIPNVEIIDFWSHESFGNWKKIIDEAGRFLEKYEVISSMSEKEIAEKIKMILTKSSDKDETDELIGYIKRGDALIYEMIKNVKDALMHLREEAPKFKEAIKLFNDRLIEKNILKRSLAAYQYECCREGWIASRISEETAEKIEDRREGTALCFISNENIEIEICEICVYNDTRKKMENQIAIAIDGDSIGIMKENYLNEIVQIIREEPIFRNRMIECGFDIRQIVSERHYLMKQRLYEKCNISYRR